MSVPTCSHCNQPLVRVGDVFKARAILGKRRMTWTVHRVGEQFEAGEAYPELEGKAIALWVTYAGQEPPMLKTPDGEYLRNLGGDPRTHHEDFLIDDIKHVAASKVR